MTLDNPRSAWPPNCMDGYLSGYLAGITRGRQLAEAEMARLHAVAYRVVQGNAKVAPNADHWAAVKTRQEAACERQRQETRPWPDEATP